MAKQKTTEEKKLEADAKAAKKAAAEAAKNSELQAVHDAAALLADERAKFEQEKAAYEAKKKTKPGDMPDVEVTVAKADNTDHTITIKQQIIRDTEGNDVDLSKYFHAPDGKDPVAPPYFNKSYGFAVDRDDLIEIFNKTFNKEDGFLFFKAADKEVYGVLIPLKYTNIGHEEDSVLGDCQYHAISFIPDGSVNLDKLKTSLKKISTLVGYSNR